MAAYAPDIASFDLPSHGFLREDSRSCTPASPVSTLAPYRLGQGPTEKQRAALVNLGVYPHETVIPATLSVAGASRAIEQAIEEGQGRREDGRLSLGAIRTNDPNGGKGSSEERRYLCPLPACAGRQNPKKHRSLSVAESGAYKCHRCESKGYLAETQAPHIEARSSLRLKPNKAAMRAMLNAEIERYQRDLGEINIAIANHIITNLEARFEIRLPRMPEPPSAASAVKLQELLAGCMPIFNTPGAQYLEEARGIPSNIAHESGVLYHPLWYGRPSVIFLAKDSEGQVVGGQGRSINGSEKMSAGSLSRAGGLFVTKGVSASPTIAITEAPIDAISILVAAGTPSIALFGKIPPSDLPLRCRNKLVLIATDSDEEGNKCADQLRSVLLRCTSVKRVKWPQGIKDANEMLLREREVFINSQVAA